MTPRMATGSKGITAVPYTGHYINLDRGIDRRAAMETQLARLDPPARYRRFAAVDGNPYNLRTKKLTDGQIGCYYSHMLLLQSHRDGATHRHVVKDDALMAKRIAAFLEKIIASGMLDEVDLLFTETTVPMAPDFFATGRAVWQSSIERAADGSANDVRFSYVPYVGCTTSYLVNRKSVALICDLLERELRSDDVPPIDMVIRAKVRKGQLRAKCLFPFITSVRPDGFVSATMADDGTRASRLAMELLRHSFFAECDMRATLDQAERLGNHNAGTQEQLHSRIAGFAVSDAFRRF